LRKHFREIRSRIPLLYRQEAARKAAHLFLQQALFKQSEYIACYLAVKDEFDCSPLIEAIWQAKKNCYLPLLTEKNTLGFARYNAGDPLRPNRYAILEPAKTAHLMTPENLDCVLMPLVAFDKEGHRLGAGGGYYDRTFSFLKMGKAKKPRMIGIAYAVQQALSLPSDPWDIVMEGVITETEFIIP
jgi:5-formyltetrahydrofolate cyclo-ligase